MVIARRTQLRFVLLALFSVSASATGAEFEWSPALGIGYDNNPYLTPDDPYIDYAALGYPLVTPIRQSGMYADLGFDGRYSRALNEAAKLLVEYKLSGDYYFDSALSNADEYHHKFSLGREQILRTQGKRQDSVYVGGFVRNVRDVYFDRDSGIGKVTASGTDVSERYNYNSLGLEAEYRNRTSDLQYVLKGLYEHRNYEDTVVIRQYDHDYVKLSADIGYRISAPTKLLAGYTYQLRDYSDRLSRDSLGRMLPSNPTLKYSYHTFDGSVRQRLSDAWVAYLDATYQTRTDAYVGYNTYDETDFRVRALYTPSDAWSMKLVLATWRRHYPNAFAFDNPTQVAKKYDGTDATIKIEYHQTQNRTLWGDIDFTKQNSTDDRYTYDRTQVVAGVQFNF